MNSGFDGVVPQFCPACNVTKWTRDQIQNEAVCISHNANSLGKGMHQTRSIIGKTELSSLFITTSLEETELNLNQLYTWREMYSARPFLSKTHYMSCFPHSQTKLRDNWETVRQTFSCLYLYSMIQILSWLTRLFAYRSAFRPFCWFEILVDWNTFESLEWKEERMKARKQGSEERLDWIEKEVE